MRDAANKNRRRLIHKAQVAERMAGFAMAQTPVGKAMESLGMLFCSLLILTLICGWTILMWGALAPAEAQELNAECVEDAMNRPGRDGAYPTGCFVKPVPVEPSNCISWDNIGPNKVCTNYRDAAETREPETQEPEEVKKPYDEIWPSDSGDELERTPEGPCRRKDWDHELQICLEPLAAEELNFVVFHPEAGTYQQHHAAAEENICRMEALLSYVAFIYFDTVAGPEHSFTQQNKLSYVVKQRECENRFGVK